ncbi:hypothetical protein BH23VER1_BH23VER1_20440 [soil metagenome]
MRIPSQPLALESAVAALPARYPPRRKYLVGVSGGRDSVVLLDLLVRAGYRRLVVAHLNHGLRGRASGQDAAFVRRLAASYGLPAAVGRRAVSGSEESGRDARMEFFASHGGRVFLGHHADDQAETVLMNFLRGAGTDGLGGMREWARRGGLELIRPLLAIGGDEIAAYAEARKLRFREDASNAGRRYLRNRVRHDLLPLAEAVMGRDVRAAVLRGAAVAREDAALLARLSADALEECLDAGGHLMAAPLLAQPVAIQRRIVREWLGRAAVPDIGFAEVERIRDLARPASPHAKLNLPGGRSVRRRSGQIWIEP